jgi:hypothetical protein
MHFGLLDLREGVCTGVVETELLRLVDLLGDLLENLLGNTLGDWTDEQTL